MRELRLYNTMTHKKEAFHPLSEKEVLFYVCGVTVYDLCHIGHARAYVVFDILRRYLTYSGYTVRYIQNFTDIDDKILKRAAELGLDYSALAQQFIDAYFEDMDRLAIARADLYPRATQYIKPMLHIIQGLIDKGAAYVVSGDVFFSVETFAPYGKLSKKILEDLEAGIRVEVNSAKRKPLDFVLWKSAKPGEPSWDSPWGLGRPGWHIECSAMAMTELGETIDIHGGGEDLVFPHHENEIAQSESFCGKPFARYWIHNGFVTIKNEKMSKSLKNFYTIREILEQFDGEDLRFFLARVHYRTPLNFSFEGLKESQQALARLYQCLREHGVTEKPAASPELQQTLVDLKERFLHAMDDDVNSAEAIGVLFDLNRFVNSHGVGGNVLFELGRVLGLFQRPIQQEEILSPEAEALFAARKQARLARDFKKSDELRDELLNQHGIIVEDTPQGVRWKRAHRVS